MIDDEELERRVRAALLEAGRTDLQVTRCYDDDLGTNSSVRVEGDGPQPPEDVWRAFSVSDPSDTPCLACWQSGRETDAERFCLSYGQALVRDCGVER